jgi:hypothetical protein
MSLLRACGAANDIDLMWLPDRKLKQRFKITSKPTDPGFLAGPLPTAATLLRPLWSFFEKSTQKHLKIETRILDLRPRVPEAENRAAAPRSRF